MQQDRDFSVRAEFFLELLSIYIDFSHNGVGYNAVLQTQDQSLLQLCDEIVITFRFE